MCAGGKGKKEGTGRDPSTPPQTETIRAERRGGSDQPLDQEDGEGRRGGLPGYTPTTEDLRIKEVYGEWVHGKPDTHLHGGIGFYGAWQGWLHDLAVMPSRCYYAPSGKDG